MAKPAGKRLKVFEAQLGFYDTVVAAPSRVAALEAWGVRQNLFASGQARVTEDAAAAEAARAHPGVPLKRAVGSKDAFALEAASLPEVPDAPRASARKAPAKAVPAEPETPPPDRGDLDAAELSLRKVDEAKKRKDAQLARREAELEADRLAAQEAYVSERKAASAAVVAARQAFRAAGGRD